MEEQLDSKSKRGISRRDFLRLLKVAGLETILIALGGGLYVRALEPAWLDVTELRLRLPRLAKEFSGFRLVQISDLHFGGWMTTTRLAHVVEVVNSLNPDSVAITGDFILGHRRVPGVEAQLGELAATLRPITERTPAFGIFGNHDYWLPRIDLLNMISDAGLMDLNNDVYQLHSNGKTLSLVGLDDVIWRRQRLEEVKTQLPSDGCAVLLVHEPDYADISVSTGLFDLQISGHSHGGQINYPFVGPLVLPSMAQKYPLGLYQVGDMLQYTNRGVGMVPPFMRFNCRPEITVFTLESA